MKSPNLLKQALILVLLLPISWILVHALAVFGVFLAIAIPITQAAFYPKVMCFWCRLDEKRHHHLFHSVINGLFILLFTAICLGLVYGEVKLIQSFGYLTSQKSVEFVIPDKNQYKLGEIFPMKIQIKGIKENINVVRTDVQFDPSLLEVVNISTDESFAKIFIQKDINNNLGYARLTGGIPSPGYKDDNGTFGTIYFRSKKPGPVEISFMPTSLVLANDGKGTNVLLDLPKADYIISATPISEDERKLQDQMVASSAATSVLGAETNNTQITLTGYDEVPPIPSTNVLGAETSTLPAPPAAPANTFLKFLIAFDQAVLMQVEHYFSLLVSAFHL